MVSGLKPPDLKFWHHYFYDLQGILKMFLICKGGINASICWGTTPSHKEMKLDIVLSWLIRPRVRWGQVNGFLMKTLEGTMDRHPFSWPGVLASHWETQPPDSLLTRGDDEGQYVLSKLTHQEQWVRDGGTRNILPMTTIHLKCLQTVPSILAL